MNSIGGVLVALIVLGGISYWNGHCFTVLFKKKEDIVFQILIGAVVFLAVFVIVELPMEKAGTSFHALVIVECAVYAVLL
ncbi:MAG: DUF6077 domain-containing protein, partial [Roseburia hominis]|nr:DUF6077 domain-containing protein [Roseburia hominis]